MFFRTAARARATRIDRPLTLDGRLDEEVYVVVALVNTAHNLSHVSKPVHQRSR